MLIDEFLPHFDVTERHALDVSAPVERVFDALLGFDMSRSAIIRVLFRLRGLPSHPRALTLDGLLRQGFILLGERPPSELLLGLVGQFWRPTGGIARLDANKFQSFELPGYAKAAWNFALAERPDGITYLTTETRVQCLDQASRRRFRLYWSIVGPFSGLVRRQMLQGIKRKAEAASGVTGCSPVS